MHKEFAREFFDALRNEDYDGRNEHDNNSVDSEFPDENRLLRKPKSLYKRAPSISYTKGLVKRARKVHQQRGPISVPRREAPVILGLKHVPFTYFSFTEKNPSENFVPPSPSLQEPGIMVPIGDLTLCRFCEEEFYDELYLLNHIHNEHEGETSELPTPEDPPEIVRKPARSKEFSPKFQCHECSKGFFNKAVWKGHMQAFHGKHGPRRNRRQKEAVNQSVDHQTLSTDTKYSMNDPHMSPNGVPYKETSDKDDKEHLKRKLVATFRCPFAPCPFKVTSESDERLREHVLSDVHDNLRRTNLKCMYCSRVSSARNGRSGFFSHIKSHDEEKPFGCDFCEKRFRYGFQKLGHESSSHTTSF